MLKCCHYGLNNLQNTQTIQNTFRYMRPPLGNTAEFNFMLSNIHTKFANPTLQSISADSPAVYF